MSIYFTEIAANRFGMGTKNNELQAIGNAHHKWLTEQIKPLYFDHEIGDSKKIMHLLYQYRQAKKQLKKKQAKQSKLSSMTDSSRNTTQQLKKQTRRMANALTVDTLQNAIKTDNSFQARLLDFFPITLVLAV